MPQKCTTSVRAQPLWRQTKRAWSHRSGLGYDDNMNNHNEHTKQTIKPNKNQTNLSLIAYITLPIIYTFMN